MAKIKQMKDMKRSPEEVMAGFSPSMLQANDYPHGLSLCLTQDELDKLELDRDAEVGDFIHLFAMAKVTSVSTSDAGNGEKCRIELQITHMSIEDEDQENEEDKEKEKPMKRRLRLYE